MTRPCTANAPLPPLRGIPPQRPRWAQQTCTRSGSWAREWMTVDFVHKQWETLMIDIGLRYVGGKNGVPSQF